MIRMSTITFIVFLIQQYVRITHQATCASNPCALITGRFDPSNGYCCTDVTARDALCTCPNNIQAVLNGPCRSINTNQVTCTKACVNGGVCNIANGQQVCWCPLGYFGDNCEIQGIANRCYAGLCQAGTCYERIIGAATYAFCQCIPGYTGVQCNQCYFTCSRAGLFPDTAKCTTGKFFFCSQAGVAPVSNTCPTGQRFNRFTNQCDSTYQCT